MMTSEDNAELRIHARLAAATIVIGLALIIMMIVVEDEPGALPLALIVGGAGWYLVTRRRARSLQK